MIDHFEELKALAPKDDQRRQQERSSAYSKKSAGSLRLVRGFKISDSSKVKNWFYWIWDTIFSFKLNLNVCWKISNYILSNYYWNCSNFLSQKLSGSNPLIQIQIWYLPIQKHHHQVQPRKIRKIKKIRKKKKIKKRKKKKRLILNYHVHNRGTFEVEICK